MDTNFDEIFQGWLEKEESHKSKGFLKRNKSWKEYFCVLRRFEGDSNIYLQWFEKEEDWRKEFPVGTFNLFPKYTVYKRKTEKGKSYFEVSNDEDYHSFMTNNEKTMDLWVIQLMMQTRLNTSMVEASFRVKGGEGKCLQRIGAKSLNCLLHVSEWGVTLALERTHSVLSQWPLTTIRNYECTDNNEFVFEAGRKSPMGEGKYHFFTNNNEDNVIFDQLDGYASMRAKRARASGQRNRLMSGDEEEIAEAYGKLRWSVMLNSSTVNLGVLSPISSAPRAIGDTDQQLYNHLRRDSARSDATTTVACGGSYDRLEHHDIFSDSISRIADTSYSRLNCSESRGSIRSPRDSYDHLERTGSFDGSPSSFESRSKSLGSSDGRSRFQFSSPPAEDSYNHLGGYRRASWSNSPKGVSAAEAYNTLDRSTMSVSEEPAVSSYDRLDSMQDNMQPAVSSYDRLDSMQDNMQPEVTSYDRLGASQDNVQPKPPPPRPRKATPQQAASPPQPASNGSSTEYDVFGNDKSHVVKPYAVVSTPNVEAPPLPEKPSFLIQGKAQEKTSIKPPVENHGVETKTAEGAQGLNGVHGIGDLSAYQDLDEATRRDRPRLDTHSSDPDLRRFAETSLDPSKRTSLHRSAPSLALYSVVNKKKDLSKGGGSTSKLDSFFKRIGRSSRKDEGSYEKIAQKSKKLRQKSEKENNMAESTSSLRRLLHDDVTDTYAEVNEANIAGASKVMQRSESSKRPLPDLPPESGMNV